VSIKKKAPSSSQSFLYVNHAKWMAIVLTMIGMVAAALVWASDEHLSIKDFAAEKAIEARREATEQARDRCSTKERVSRIETCQEILVKKIDVIESQVNDIHKLLIKGKNK